MHNFKAHKYIPHAAVLVPALLQTSVPVQSVLAEHSGSHAAVLVPALLQTSVPVQSVLAEHSGSTKRIESCVLKSVY